MGRSALFLRAVSFILLQAFLVEQISWADVVSPSKQNPFLRPEVSLSIPESIVTIEDAYKSPSDKTVYLIQDAHTNESGQLNLAKTLDHLLGQDKGLKYVFLEAGVGDNSLSFLRPYTELSDRKKRALSYIKKGLLHGEEYLDLTSDHDFTLWGVEDPDLYIKSLEDYKAVAKDRERFDLYLKKIDQTLETLKAHLLNPSLSQFDKDMRKFQKEELTLTQYFQVLLRESTLENIDLTRYPHLKNLEALKAQEDKIDFIKANEEQTKALKALSADEQKELTDLTESQTNSPFKLSSNDSKEAKAFYTLLEEKLTRSVIARSEATKQSKPAQIASATTWPRNDYPNLFKYFSYLKTARSIEAKSVLSELKALENEILDLLSKTEDEKTLVKSQKVLRHLEKLFHFTLTPEEFKDYKELTSSFGIEHLAGFLNKKILDLGAYYERSLFLEKGYEDMVKHSEEFYSLTTKRDEFFVSEMLSKMQSESQNKAVLVTGGFHTQMEMISRRAFGFRNFENYRLRVKVLCG